jgi:hypothetical protein
MDRTREVAKKNKQCMSPYSHGYQGSLLLHDLTKTYYQSDHYAKKYVDRNGIWNKYQTNLGLMSCYNQFCKPRI